MSARSVDTLAEAIEAIARGNVSLSEGSTEKAASVRHMLGEVLDAVARLAVEPETRSWAGAAVLVARHLERVANNGAELAGRVRFLVTGEMFVRRPAGGGSRAGGAS